MNKFIISNNKNLILPILKVYIFAISILVSIFIAINSYNIAGYNIYFLVPLFYGYLVLVCKEITSCLFKRIGLTVMLFVLLIRYVALPYIACLGNYSSTLGVKPSGNLVFYGIILTLMEMVTIFFVSTLLIKNLNKKNWTDYMLQNSNEINGMEQNKITSTEQLNSTLIYKFLILMAILIIVLFPEVISDYRFIFGKGNYVETISITFPGAGLFRTIIIFAQYIAVLLIINYSYKKYLERPRFKYVIYSISSVLINMTITSNLSRFTILVPAIAFTYLLITLFQKEKNKIAFILFGGLFVGLTFLSVIKFFGQGRGNIGNAVNYAWWANTFQAYFAGPKNIAIAIRTKELVKNIYGVFPVKLLFTDLFSNVAVINKLVETDVNSIKLFNYSYYGSTIAVDQIVPLIGTGYFYFGFIFSPLWTAICVSILFWLDEKVLKSKCIDQRFLFSYVSIYFGLATILNTSTIFSIIFNTLILLLAVMIVNKYIVLRMKIKFNHT